MIFAAHQLNTSLQIRYLVLLSGNPINTQLHTFSGICTIYKRNRHFFQWATPLHPLCLLNLEDPALRVDQEVQDGLSPQQGQSLQSGPEMSHINDKNVRATETSTTAALDRFRVTGYQKYETLIYFNVDIKRGMGKSKCCCSACQTLQYIPYLIYN